MTSPLQEYLSKRTDDFGRFCFVQHELGPRRYKVLTKVLSKKYCSVPVVGLPFEYEHEDEVLCYCVIYATADSLLRVLRFPCSDCILEEEPMFSMPERPKPYKLSDFHVGDTVFIGRNKRESFECVCKAKVLRVGRKYVTVDLYRGGVEFKIPEWFSVSEIEDADHLESMETAWDFFLFKNEDDLKLYAEKIKKISEIRKMEGAVTMRSLEKLSFPEVEHLWNAYHEITCD